MPISWVYWIGKLTANHLGRLSAVEYHITEVNRNSAPVSVLFAELNRNILRYFPEEGNFSFRYGHAINRQLAMAKIMPSASYKLT